jgi:hypothetical protein
MGRRRRISTKEVPVNGVKHAVVNGVVRRYNGTDALGPTSRPLGMYVESFKVTGNPKQTPRLVERELGRLMSKTGDNTLKHVVHDERRRGDKIEVTCYVYSPGMGKKKLDGFKPQPDRV